MPMYERVGQGNFQGSTTLEYFFGQQKPGYELEM